MNAFLLNHKNVIVAVISIVIGLAWGYFLFFFDSEITKWVGSNEFLVLAGIFLGFVFGKETKERIVLIIMSSLCSLGMLYLFSIIMFFIATGRFLEYYRHYPW